jgi:hypothetical protein
MLHSLPQEPDANFLKELPSSNPTSQNNYLHFMLCTIHYENKKRHDMLMNPETFNLNKRSKSKSRSIHKVQQYGLRSVSLVYLL